MRQTCQALQFYQGFPRAIKARQKCSKLEAYAIHSPRYWLIDDIFERICHNIIAKSGIGSPRKIFDEFGARGMRLSDLFDSPEQT